MAGFTDVNLRVFVLDTSYLLEILRLPGFDPIDAEEITRRFRRASLEAARHHRIFVPVSVIFETARHVSFIRGDERRRFALQLARFVKEGSQEDGPWIITPQGADQLKAFVELCEAYSSRYAAESLSLTDVSVIEVASGLKRRRYDHPGQYVHIWTKEKAIKACEPDLEPDAFLGRGS